MECFKDNPDCKYYEKGCFSNVHHEYWPKKLYRDSIGRIFRELPENKARMCAEDHDELHANQSPPVKPGREQMLEAIGRMVVGEEYGEITA